jgi:hypothetical protein
MMGAAWGLSKIPPLFLEKMLNSRPKAPQFLIPGLHLEKFF